MNLEQQDTTKMQTHGHSKKACAAAATKKYTVIETSRTFCNCTQQFEPRRSEAFLLTFDCRWRPDVKESSPCARRGPRSGDRGSIRKCGGWSPRSLKGDRRPGEPSCKIFQPARGKAGTTQKQREKKTKIEEEEKEKKGRSKEKRNERKKKMKHFEAKMKHFEAKMKHFEAQMKHVEPKMKHFEAKIKHSEAKNEAF